MLEDSEHNLEQSWLILISPTLIPCLKNDVAQQEEVYL